MNNPLKNDRLTATPEAIETTNKMKQQIARTMPALLMLELLRKNDMEKMPVDDEHLARLGSIYKNTQSMENDLQDAYEALVRTHADYLTMVANWNAVGGFQLDVEEVSEALYREMPTACTTVAQRIAKSSQSRGIEFTVESIPGLVLTDQPAQK